MAMKDEQIEVQWGAHSDPRKVGEKEKLRPREARAAVRTGQAQYVNDKDAPPARPSMNTREEALKASKAKKPADAPAPVQAEAKK